MARNELHPSKRQRTMAHREQQVVRRAIFKDPINHLPPEIQLLIFENLQLRDVMRSRRVSRAWNRQLTSPEFAVLYRHFDLIRGNSSVGAQSNYIKACVKYSRGGMKRAILDLPKTSSMLSRAFDMLVRSSRKLETLVLLNIGFSVQDVIRSIPLLLQLTGLVLSATVDISAPELRQILASSVNLVELDIRAISVAGVEMVSNWNTNCRKLQRLRLAIKNGIMDLGHDRSKVSSIYAP